jgi:hypothetical protein
MVRSAITVKEKIWFYPLVQTGYLVISGSGVSRSIPGIRMLPANADFFCVSGSLAYDFPGP